jgi:O-antigen ligase/Flp pilus assembly protein TadD
MDFLRFQTTTGEGEVKPVEVARPQTPLNLAGFFGKVLSFGTVLLAFLIPLFFLPFTSEFYEFNKQALLVAGAVILTVAWFGKMWAEKELRFVRTPLDLPILLFVLVYIITTIFSLSPFVSLFGHFGRFNGGLITIISYALLYFVYVNNVRSLDHIKRIAWGISLSATLLAIHGLLQYFGIYLIPWDVARNRFFTPAGSPNALALFLMAALPVMLSLIAVSRQNPLKIIFTIGSVASFAYIALVGGGPSPVVGLLIGAALALVIFFYFAREATFGKNRTLFTALAVIFLALSSLIVPVVRDRLPVDFRDIPKEVNLDWGSSWAIAASTLRDRPIQGSGPDTFLFDFTRFRDVSLNSTPYWNLRFDRANSELLQVLATMGLLGLAAFLFFVYRAVKLGLAYLPKEKELETHTLSVGFAAGALSLITLAVLFGYFSTATAFMLWLSLALLVRLWVEEKQVVVKSTVISIPVGGQATEGRRDILPALVFFPAVVIAALFLFIFGRMYMAEAYFQQSLVAAQANDGRATYDAQVQALQMGQLGQSTFQIRVDRDIYHRTFASTNLLLANSLAGQENPDATTVQQLVSQSINEARLAKDLNPWDVNNWEQLATIYRNLINFAEGSDQFAEQSYIQAIQLDPFNVRLRDALGSFYSQVKRWDEAIQVLVVAVNLKPDLAAARFDLAKAYVGRSEVAGTANDAKRQALTLAKNELEATLRIVTAGSADEKQVNDELASVNAKLAPLGGPITTAETQTSQPTATPSGTQR